MAIWITLAFFFLSFFFIKRHVGPAHLAMIAGLSVYELFGKSLADTIHNMFDGSDLGTIQIIVYLVFVLIFPLILYIRSNKGGMTGLLRIIEAAIFAISLTSLLAWPLSEFFTFDVIAKDLTTWIASIQGFIVIAALVSAYLDILLYHHPD